MFKKKISLFLLLSIPLFSLWIYKIVLLHPTDIHCYQQMISEKAIARSNPYSPTNQQRKKVCKDIWFAQNDASRLHYHIVSDGSLLTLTPVNNKLEMVESLQGIKCWMQDKLVTHDGVPMQQTRLIEADKGSYSYATQEFTANDVLLFLFKLPGHSLPKDPVNKDNAFLQGVANDISFLLSGKTPQFQAKEFITTEGEE